MKTPNPQSPKLENSLSALLRLTKPLTNKTLATKALNKDKEEAELKQQILSTLLSEEKPIEGFKKYLDLLIIKKTGKNSDEIRINTEECAKSLIKDICKDSATLKLEEKLQKKARKLKNFSEFPEKSQENDEKSEENEGDRLENIRKRNHLIIHTSQKLKNRMKLEKIDKEKLFNARTMKHFANLDTFINAKEFLQQINPFYKREGQENDKIRTIRLLNSVKTFQNKISAYFDQKIGDFMQRIQENPAISEEIPEKQGTFSSSSSSSSSFSKENAGNSQVFQQEKQYFEKLYNKVREKERNPEKTPIKPSVSSKKPDFFAELEKKKDLFKYLQRNSLFVRHNMGENPEFVKLFQEFYNPSGLLRKNPKKTAKDEDFLSRNLVKQLISTDPSLNEREFQAENGSFQAKDEFFEKTLGHFSKQEHFSRSLAKGDAFSEKSSIKSLETLVQEILNEQKSKKSAKNSDIAEKYQEFKEKASNVLKLIAKTSKIIFNEKNRSFAEGKRSFLQRNDEKFAKIKENRRKALTNMDLSNIFSLTNRENPVENGKNGKSASFSKKIPGKPPSISDFSVNLLKSRRTHAKTVSFPAVSEFSAGNCKEIKETAGNRKEIAPKKGKSSSFFVNKLNHIINQAELVKEKFSKETQNLKEIQRDSQSFFNEQKSKLKPRLESLAMTFDPIKIKHYHKKVKSFYREKVRKEKQKLVASNELYKE